MQEMWNCIELHSRSLLSPIFTIDSGRVASDDEISPAIILLVFFNLDSKVFKTSLFAMETIPSKLISLSLLKAFRSFYKYTYGLLGIKLEFYYGLSI